MVEVKMSGNSKDIFSDRQNDIHSTGVVVDDVAYDTGVFIDRDYNMKDKTKFFLRLENIGANSIDYTIRSTRKEVEDLGKLVDADYETEELAATAVAATAFSADFTMVKTLPDVTAIRLRAKETVGGSPGTIRADIRTE